MRKIFDINGFFKADIFSIDFSGKKILVVGMGGGSDEITAYAFSQSKFFHEQSTVVYGNTKLWDREELVHVSPHIATFPPNTHCDEVPDDYRYYFGIDMLVPQGPLNCPLLFLLLNERSDLKIIQELNNLEFDLIIGIDNGGDSLVESPFMGPESRDKRMLKILQGCDAKFMHVIFGFGCDGECAPDLIIQKIAECEEKNLYRGCFNLGFLKESLSQFIDLLPNNRTPMIILDAINDKLPKDDDGQVDILRGLIPKIPIAWLTHGFVFEYFK